MNRTLPKYIHEFADRHGRVRRYFRYRGRNTPITHDPGTPQFDVRYAELLEGRFGKVSSWAGSQRGYVYFIQGASDRIKIGFSEKPHKRLAALQTAHPERLSIIRILDGTKNDERRLHIRFARLRLTGEWFKATPSLLAFIGQEKAA